MCAKINYSLDEDVNDLLSEVSPPDQPNTMSFSIVGYIYWDIDRGRTVKRSEDYLM